MESLTDLQIFQPTWSADRKRHERSLVTTRYGEVSGDPALELEWRKTEKHMNGLLETYLSALGGSALADVYES